MTTYRRAAMLGGLVTAGGSALAYASTRTSAPTTETGLAFLVAGVLLLVAYVAGTRHPVLGAAWAIPAFTGVVVLAVPEPAGRRELSVLLAMLGVATAVAWPAVHRGRALANRFGDRVWRQR